MALRLQVTRQILEEHLPASRVARAFGLSLTTVNEWLRRYKAEGEAGLVPKPQGPARQPATGHPTERTAVVAARETHPDWGSRRIRDALARFEGLGVSDTTVRKILHEAGLMPEYVPMAAREHPPRRFERAAPNQLWQSDIFTFLLRRHERLYVAAFMDDHSRFLVSWTLAHHQRSELVLEALRRGTAAYGSPQEILTDQGRQYTAWRGETEFEQELRREGIRHVKSRPQHPQTLGKIERFFERNA